jgi:NADH-quinone oxidoreductase subunit F
MKGGKKLKGVIPGGTSAPILNADECAKATLDYECLASMGTMLGSGSVIVMDETRCMVDMLGVISHFYHHESCGQCTPCREGTGWLNKMMHSILSAEAKPSDIDLLCQIADKMQGKTICALSDAAALPVLGIVPKFRDEFIFYVREGYSKVHGPNKGFQHGKMHH